MFTSEKLFASYFETFSNGYTENSRITIVTTCWKSSCKLAMALLCFEQEFIPRSFADKTILNDKRVMENLLAAEDLYTLSSDYFANRFQADIRPNMRKTVVEWMFEASTLTVIATCIYPKNRKNHILPSVFNDEIIFP